MTNSAKRILQASLAPATRKAYLHLWHIFLEWVGSISLPVHYITICNFIGHLFEIGYSPSSIASHISALTYIHKMLKLPDPAQCFLVQKLLRGCYKLGPSVDTRLPITGEILKKLVNSLDQSVSTRAHSLLLKALFLMAFHGFFRLGELVIKSKTQSDKVIQRSDVHFETAHGKLKQVQVVLKHFKTVSYGQPKIITLEVSKNTKSCPVHALFYYLKHYRHSGGPLFQFLDGCPVPYSFVAKKLNEVIKNIGLDPKHYKGHSFRIGAATHASKVGFSENAIQNMGRWKSDAVKRYIRLGSFNVALD